MASRVNTKFVIILVVGVIALLGLVMLAYSIAVKSSADLARSGDELMASGDYKLAERHYSKAVNKDITNTEILDKWVNALDHIVPETETEYRDRFYSDYIGAIKKISTISRNDVEAHERYLSIRYQILEAGFNRSVADLVISETGSALAFFNEDPSQVGQWETLKRYRGLAIDSISKRGLLLEDNQYLLALDDLERALLADPDDVEVAIGLISMTKANLLRGIADHEKEAQVEAVEEALQIANSFLATHPQSIEMQMMSLFLRAEIGGRQIKIELNGNEQVHAQRAALMEYQDEIDGIADRLLGANSDQLTVKVIEKFFTLESVISPDSLLANTRQMIDQLIATNKENGKLLLLAGQVARAASDFDEALGWYSQVIDLEAIPLSHEGMQLYSLKRTASLQQTLIKVDEAQRVARNPESAQSEMDSSLESATLARDQYAGEVSEDNQPLMLIDGRLASIRGEDQEALRLFKKYNELTLREVPEGLWQEGRTAFKLNQLGIARDAFLEMIPRETTNRKFLAMLSLASIYEQLNDLPAAAQLYHDILAISPDLEQAVSALERIEKIMNPSLNDDPVVAAVLTARQIRNGVAGVPGDLPAAIEYLREHIASLNYDPRIAKELASVLFDRHDVGGAIEVLTKALEHNPDEEWIRETLSVMNSDDPVGSRIAMIRQADGDQLPKLLTIARIAMENNRPELLEETIAELVKIAPEDSGVIEIRFLSALRQGDVEAAKQIAEAGSLSPTVMLNYQARIAMVEEDPARAIQLLEQAVASGAADANIFQMLAILRRNSGDTRGSIEAFEQSLAITPDNPNVIGEYLLTLTRASMHEEALSAARRLQRHGMSNNTFLNLWLNLEAIYGGDAGQRIAIEQRQRIYDLDPSNLENAGQLARMYIMTEQWDESKAIIEHIRSVNDTIALVELEATWYANQGNVDGQNGLVVANELFAQYIEKLGDSAGVEPYITNAEFMLRRGRPDLAVIAANEAVARQDTKTMMGSKLLGDLYSQINNHSKAVAAYQDVIDAGADEDFSIRNRLIGTLSSLDRFEEAQVLYEQLPESMKSDMITMILASEIATGLGDDAKANKILNDAVAQYPSDSYVYIKRAQLMIGDESLINDLLSDISRAIELNSNDWRAYRVRAAAYFAIGRRDEALNDLRTTIRLNPSLNKSIFAILNELLDEPGGAAEALDVAREIIEQRSDDATLMARIGSLFASREEWVKASEIYGMAWNKRHAVNDGAVYIDSLVRQTPPDAQTATAVITEISKMVGDINKSPGLLAAQALVLQARGRDDFAIQQLSKAFDLSVGSNAEIIGWSGNLSRFYEGLPAADHIAYLESLKRRNANLEIHAWLDLFIAGRMAREDEVDPRFFEILTGLSSNSTNTGIQLRAYKLHGSMLYDHERFAEAAAVWESGLSVFSDDWEMNNNLAYVLSKELGKHEEALAYGQRAIDQNIARSEAYETMAGIYLRLQKYDEAEQMIDIGSNYLRTIPANITMLVTSGRLHLARGEIVEARSSLTDAHSIIRSSSTAYPSLKEDIDSLEAEINSADG